MLTNRLKKFYFEEKHAVILPDSKGENNLQLAATVAANFMSLGMTMNEDMTRKLGEASREDIIDFYKEYIQMAKESMSDLPDPRVFYANFPEEVMEKSDFELFIDQICHYIDSDYIPSKYEEAQMAFPFIGKVQQHPVVEGSEQGYEDLMKTVMKSAVSYTPRQVRMIRACFEDDRNAASYAPSVMKQKENMIILGMTQKDTTGKDTLLQKFLKDPIDVLRYAAVKSALRDAERKGLIKENADAQNELYEAAAYQKASLQYNKADRPSFILSKQDRKFVAKQLERIANGSPERLARDMYRHRQDWKRLIKIVHIGDFKDCKATAKAFSMTSHNVSVDRHDKIVEEAIKVDDLKTALNEAVKYPGDLIGRADKFLRMAKTQEETDMVLDAIRATVKDAGIAKTVGLMSEIGTRNKADESRTFVIAKTKKTVRVTNKNREALDERTIRDVKAACIDGLAEKFRGKGNMGKVYISPEMCDYTVPTNTRNANDSIETYPTGSKINLHTDGEVQRLFVTWTNLDIQPDKEKLQEAIETQKKYYREYEGIEVTQEEIEKWEKDWTKEEQRLDIDLSAAMYTEDGEFFCHCGWNNSYRGKDDTGKPMYVFSGDITDGEQEDGRGAAEYIDLNIEALKQNGVRYVVTNVNSYRNQPFIDQPHTSFGVMQRSYDDMGKPFEPQSVETKMRLIGKATHEIPVIFDVYEDKMIWVDRAFDGRVASSSHDIKPLLDFITNQAPMSLSQLIDVNVRGNGEFVNDPRNADTLYITPREEKEMRDRGIDLEGKEVIYPYNLDHITGVLMAEPEKGVKERERELDVERIPEEQTMSPEDIEQMEELEKLAQAEMDQYAAIEKAYREDPDLDKEWDDDEWER